MRRKLINADYINQTITEEELAFNIWYSNELNRLGLVLGFDDITNEDIKPFKNKNEYLSAICTATSLLYNKQKIPKELEEKLLIVAEQKRKKIIT